METIVTDAMDRFQELEVWQTALLGTAVLFFMFICFGNFEPSAVRRAKVTRTHVFSSNIVMFFVLVVSVVVTGTLYFVGMTDAAFCGFIGVVVYFANSLVAGGAFLGIVFWGVGTLGTMHVMNANFGFQDMTSYFILFTVALVLAYPAFALVFPDMLVNATAAWVLSTVLCWDDTVTTQQSWLVCGVIFFLLQMVAHASYRTNETSWLAGAAICAMVLVAHAQALVKLDDLTLLVAVLAGVLGVLTVMHNRKTSVFVRYDPHETRAMVVSLVAFLIAVRLAAVEASGASQYSNGLLYLAVGHAMASALSAFIFLVGALWLPEDASAWRLTAIDCVLLVPFIVVPLSLVVYNGGVLQYAFGIAASWGVADNFVVEYVKSQSPQQLLFLTIAISRAMSDLCVRALSSHSMTFLPLVALTYDRGSARSNLLGLTFNGGPDPESTPALLQALAEYEAKATFFITLERALAYPKLVRDIHDDGHQIGVLGTARVDVFGIAAVTEARKACRVITYITGVSPTLYRPPVSGGRSPLALQAIANMGMTITMWSLCPWEWQGTEAEVYSRVPSFVDAAGYVVLLHEVIPSTISGELVPKTNMKCVDTAALLLRDLAGKAMQCVRIDELCLPSAETLP